MTRTTTTNRGEKWDINQAAKAFKLTKTKILKAIRSGNLPVAEYPGGTIRLDPYDVRDWVDQYQQHGNVAFKRQNKTPVKQLAISEESNQTVLALNRTASKEKPASGAPGICRTCGIALEKTGKRGRPPVYCPEHLPNNQQKRQARIAQQGDDNHQNATPSENAAKAKRAASGTIGVCRTCGTTLEKTGKRGRPPVYCPEHLPNIQQKRLSGIALEAEKKRQDAAFEENVKQLIEASETTPRKTTEANTLSVLA